MGGGSNSPYYACAKGSGKSWPTHLSKYPLQGRGNGYQVKSKKRNSLIQLGVIFKKGGRDIGSRDWGKLRDIGGYRIYMDQVWSHEEYIRVSNFLGESFLGGEKGAPTWK